jgi:hypothetical protein
MTEYTDSPDAIAAWREQLARTGLWIDRHRPRDSLFLVHPDEPPTPDDEQDDAMGELSVDADRYSSKSVPPRMLLRYNDGRPDMPIEEYAGGRSARRHLPTLDTHPMPENIQIRPSRSNSSGGPTPVSARPAPSRASSTPIHSSPLTGDHIPPYPQQIAVWKTPSQSPQTSPAEYGAPPMAYAQTHPPTHHPAFDPRASMSTAPVPVPYRGTISPRSRAMAPPMSVTHSQPPGPPSMHPSHVSSRHSTQSHRPLSPNSGSTHSHSHRTRHDSLRQQEYSRPHEYSPSSRPHEYASSSRPHEYSPSSRPHEYSPSSRPHEYASSSRQHEYAPTTSSSRRGPPVVYSSRAVSRSGSQPPPVVYAPRAHGASIDEHYDPPPISHSRGASADLGGRGRDDERGRTRTLSHAPRRPTRDESVGSAVLVEAPSPGASRRGRSVPRTASSGSTYYVLPAKGQKVRVLVSRPSPASASPPLTHRSTLRTIPRVCTRSGRRPRWARPGRMQASSIASSVVWAAAAARVPMPPSATAAASWSGKGGEIKIGTAVRIGIAWLHRIYMYDFDDDLMGGYCKISCLVLVFETRMYTWAEIEYAWRLTCLMVESAVFSGYIERENIAARSSERAEGVSYQTSNSWISWFFNLRRLEPGFLRGGW